MSFKSILFNQESFNLTDVTEPPFFTDLNLDQVLSFIIASKKEYNLASYFYLPLHNYELITFRNEVMKDLEIPEIYKAIENFSDKMVIVRRYLKLIEKLEFEYHKKGWFLEAILQYCDAVSVLIYDLSSKDLMSRGLKQFVEYLNIYTNSDFFKSISFESSEIKSNLSSIQYTVNVDWGKFSVQRYEDEINYSTEVLAIFDKFRKGAVKDHKKRLLNKSGMNHVESKMLEFVIHLFPEPFNALNLFCNKYPTFLDDIIVNFDREIQFYVSYIQFITKIKTKGLNFCYPEICEKKEDIYANNSFDIALALSELESDNKVVCNDFHLTGQERIIIVSGPNQGGKTTFARMFGQLHYFTRLGFPIPGNKAKIFLTDKIFTHFEKEESITTLQGKLLNELTRLKNIFSQISSDSVIIMNEIFTSTTLDDAIFLGTEILEKLISLDVYCVMVTFIDELSRLGPKVISMVSNIVPEDPTLRTFKIIREQADGLAYALSIAKKNRLTYDQIKERILP